MGDFCTSFRSMLKSWSRDSRRTLRRKKRVDLHLEQLERREVPANGLVAAYNFDQGVGAQLTDLSGNKNNGTITNATWSSVGKYGKSLYFNGSNAMVSIADSASLDLTKGMTIEAWVNASSLSGWRTVLLKERPGGLSYSLYATDPYKSPSAPSTFISMGRRGDVGAAGPGALTNGAWVFLTGTYDGANLRIYVNGQLMSTTAVSGSMLTSTGALRIGGNTVWGEYFKGYIDNVRIYNTALSQAQIATDMATPVSAPPVAALSVSAGVGGTINEGGSFQFNGSASGGSGSYTYAWNFGDGSTGVGASVAHVYKQNGNFSAVLTVTDSLGHTGLSSAALTVNNVAPSGLILTRDKTSISENGSLSLSGSFNDPGADTESVVITWGDGQTTTLNLSSTQRTFSTSHQYLDNPTGQPTGSFTINVTVTDQNNAITSGTASIQVNNVAPTATIASTVNDKTAAFSASVTDPGTKDTFTYLWNFGDGSTSTAASPSHAYANYGTYMVTLKVTDKDGGATSSSKSVNLAAVVLTVNAGANGAVNEGSGYQFNGSASGGSGPYTYAWNFGDGSTGTGASLSHVYSQNGTFAVKLTATDTQGHTGQGSATITVNNVAPTGLTLTRDKTTINENGNLTLSGSFTDPGADTEAVVITWGDGQSTTVNLTSAQRTFSAAHQYLDNPTGQPTGSFAIGVTVTDQNSASTSGASSIQVTNVAPTATLSSAINNKTVGFSAAVTDPGTKDTFTYLWNFGDGSTSTAASPSHTYANYGTYSVSVTVTDKDVGSSGAVTKSLTLSAPADTTAPSVNITGPANNASVAGMVTITASASDNVGVAGVTFLLDGQAMGAEVTSSPYSYYCDTTKFTNGVHSLTAKARDAAGNTATSTGVSISINNPVPDTTAPTVSLTAPANNASVTGAVTITATASDNVGVAGVTFLLDGVAMGAEDTTSPYSYSWDSTKAANGSHTLTARARDAAGNTTTSSAVTVSVSNTSAAPTNLIATAGNAQVVLSWAASSGATSYNIYRAATSGGEGSTPIKTGVSTTSFTDSGLTNGTTYYYQVSAVSSIGEGAKSSEASAKPLAAASLVQAVTSGSAIGTFTADAAFVSGSSSTYTNTDTINTSNVTNPAPSAVYDSERFGTNFTYTFPNLTAGATYTVRLHFAEIYRTSAGVRIFNVAINGTQVLSNFDIFAVAGGKDIANVQQFSAVADASGNIAINFTSVMDNAKVSGIEILTAGSIPPPPADTTPPTVTSVSPAAGTTNVGVVANITVYVSETLNAATITNSTVHVKDSAGNIVPVSLNYYVPNKAIVLDPIANLAYSSTYTIEVIGGANGVKDLAGNALASTLTSTFQTGAAPTGGGQFIVTPFDKIPNFGANPTIVSAISGNWSSTTTWSTGHVPLANEVVSIAAGTTVTYDLTMASADAVKTVVIQAGGKLIFRTDISTTLYVSNFLVLEGGELVVGTQANPVAANVTASIILANKPLDTTNDPEQYGNSLIALGKVTMYGAVKSSFVTLATEPKAGDTTLKLAQIATGWKAGDKLELPDSKQWAANSGPYVPENEEVVVASVSADGLTLTLTTPLQFNHPGAYDGNGVLNFLPEVANRTHNVVVRSESAPGNRGHVMFTYHADIDIRYASFAGLGRTTIDPIDNTTVDSSGAVTHVGTNENDRNPVNFDHLFGPSTIPADGYQYTFLGNAVFCPMPSIRYKWGITITDSHYGLIQDNFIYNWAGSGLVTEQGNESYNVIAHNFSLLGRGEGDRQGSGKPGDEGVGFWFRGTNNYVHDNVAANWVGNQVEAAYGYKFYMYYLNDVNIPKFQGADMSVAGQYVTKPGNAMPILEFARNEVYGVENGLTVWWLNAYGTSPQGGGVSTIKDFRGWNLSRYGFYGYPMSNVVFDGYVIRGDKSVLSNTHEDLIGLWFGDYMTSGLTVRNSDIQGCRVGFIDPYYGGTTTTIQDSYFNNVVNIQVRSIGAPGSGPNGADRSSKSLIIRNVRFGSTASWNLGGWTPENIQMAYDLHDGSSNLVKSDTVFVYDYNGVVGNNFQLFYKEQASTYVVPQTSGNLAAAPVAGLTNQQLWSQYQMAIAGAVATNTTTMSLIDGLIKTI